MSADRTSRDTAPRYGAAPFFGYLSLVITLGLCLVGWCARQLSAHDLAALGAGFVLVATLVVLAETKPLVLAGMPDANGVTITTTFVFAALLLWGLPVAVLLQSVATFIGEQVWRKAWWRSLFNVAQYALSWGAAGAVLALWTTPGRPEAPHVFGQGDILPAMAAAAAYFLVNDALVAKAIALRVRSTFRQCFAQDFVYQFVSSAALLSLGPFVAVASDRSVWLPLLLLVPALALYRNAAVTLEKEHASLHDALTGLPNRKLLLARASQALGDSGRGDSVALLLLDLDRFKEVNDTLGHQVGDRLLQAVADRLRELVRSDDVVARLGGDEFAVLLAGLPGVADAEASAERIAAALRETFDVDGMRFDLEASVGLALYPQHAGDFASMLRRADVAMYVAKETRCGVALYDETRDHNSTERLGLLGALRRAIDEGQLELHYQPKVALAGGHVVGMEALVRWRHPEKGLIGPDAFIPLAEQTGLMRAVTDAVVEVAVRQAASWHRQGIGVPVAVNVCVRDLHDMAFPEHVRRLCHRFAVDPAELQLEVTEGLFMEEPERAAGPLAALGEIGVTLSLDDFGTGYSSLGQLKQLPVREIKIDRSFVQRMDNPDDAAIVRTIIELGGSLGLQVVAEGVEDHQTERRLRQLGCPTAQGYHFARPMDGDTATAWLLRVRQAGTTRAVLPA